MEPGTLAELAEANIRAIVVRYGRPTTPLQGPVGPGAGNQAGPGRWPEPDLFVLWGLDDQFRELR